MIKDSLVCLKIVQLLFLYWRHLKWSLSLRLYLWMFVLQDLHLKDLMKVVLYDLKRHHYLHDLLKGLHCHQKLLTLLFLVEPYHPEYQAFNWWCFKSFEHLLIFRDKIQILWEASWFLTWEQNQSGLNLMKESMNFEKTFTHQGFSFISSWYNSILWLWLYHYFSFWVVLNR